MPYFDNDGIKRRREERVRLLRKKMEDTYSSYFFDSPHTTSPETDSFYPLQDEEEPWNQPPRVERKRKKTKNWLVRFLLSLFLLSGAYVISVSQFPQTRPYHDFLQEVLTRSYNFSAMTAWYEDKFGALPTILPSIGPLSDQAKPVLQQGQTPLLKAPVTGKMKPNNTPENGIYLQTTDSVVKSIDRGKVIFVGEKQGIGKTVVVQHSQGIESWYGGFDTVNVSLNDWVEVQQPLGKTLGTVTVDKGVYFAIKKDGKFVDPRSVVRLE